MRRTSRETSAPPPKRIEFGPGDALNHEGGVPHRWAPAGDDPAGVLIVNNFQH